MSLETNWFQIIGVMVTISGLVVGAIVGLTKWIGRSEGKQSVTSTVIENTIKQLESMRSEVEAIRKDISSGNIQTTRLEERLKYMLERLDSLCMKMDRLMSDSQNRYDSDDHRRPIP
jgi:predicted transcriptional regulator